MMANQLADLMLRHVWNPHRTPKTNFLEQGRIFISQIINKINKHLNIQLHLSTLYHHRSDVQSEVVNKAVEKNVRRLNQVQQNEWELLLSTTGFLCNKLITCPLEYQFLRRTMGIDIHMGGSHKPRSVSPLLKRNPNRWKVTDPSWMNALEKHRIQQNRNPTRQSDTHHNLNCKIESGGVARTSQQQEQAENWLTDW